MILHVNQKHMSSRCLEAQMHITSWLLLETLYKVSIGMGEPKLVHTILDGGSRTLVNECVR